jgi:uncharacterized membrane protein YoaK (UPF0700 family)
LVPFPETSGASRQSAAPQTASTSAPDVELIPASRSDGSSARGSMMPSSNMRVYSALLSGVAGYVDAAGFISLLGLFPAHLTGELVGEAIAIATGQAAGRLHLWVLPVFIGSVVLATLVARVCRRHGREARAGLLLLVALALASFAASDALAWLLHEGRLPLLVRGGFAVAAMGFQSALMRESLTGSCPTTVMTGNITQVVIDVIDHVIDGLLPSTRAKKPAPGRLTSLAGALLVFTLSAALGAWLTHRFGSISVTLPAVLTAVLAVQAWQQDIARRMPAIPGPAAVPHFEDDAPWCELFDQEAEQGADQNRRASESSAVGAVPAAHCGSEARLKPAVSEITELAPKPRVLGGERA